MNKLYETQLKDQSGVTHIYMRGLETDIIDRIINYPSDDVPLFIEQQDRIDEFWVHFILI